MIEVNMDKWLNRVICGDCLQIMRGMPDESIDLVVTDPPYGWSFMGKKWDTFKPQGAYEHRKGFKALPRNTANGMLEFFTPVWREVLRMLKPGAFAFVMCGPRQDCLARQIIALEDAGFKIGFTSIYWTFASGFPKAQNVAKKIDTRKGLKGKVIGKKKVVDVQSCGAVGDLYQQVNKLPMKEVEVTDSVSKEAQSLAGGYSGFQPKPAVEVILVAMKSLSEKTYVDQAMRNRKGISWLDEGRIPYKSNEGKEGETICVEAPIKSSVNNVEKKNGQRGEAKKQSIAQESVDMKGQENQLGQGQEDISTMDILCSEETLKGDMKGNLSIDMSGNTVTEQSPKAMKSTTLTETKKTIELKISNACQSRFTENGKGQGRFPANLLVSDDVLNDGKVRRVGGNKYKDSQGMFMPCHKFNSYNDSGSFSRYFSLDQWWTEKLLDRHFSKAYNKDKNKGGALWEANQVEGDLGSKRSGISVNGAGRNSRTMKATEKSKSITSAQRNATPALDSKDPSRNAEYAEKKSDCIGTDIAQRLAQIKQDTETLLVTLEKGSTIHTTQSKPSLFSQSVVNYVIKRLKGLKDIIQILTDQLKLSGSVSLAIIEQTLLDLSQDRQWQNFWQERVSLLPENQRRTFPFAIICKASKSEKNRGLGSRPEPTLRPSGVAYNEHSGIHQTRKTGNNHPTCKPIKLMSYLITLGSRSGDVVLDPFAGSGTTSMAAKMDGRDYIGIEIDSEYCKIARGRIDAMPLRLL